MRHFKVNQTLQDACQMISFSKLSKLIFTHSKVRKFFERRGVNITPSNFYSTIPSMMEIENSFEYKEKAPPYLDPKIFDAELLRETLRQLIPYSEDFSPAQDGDEDNCTEFYWGNSQFSYSDAMSYYAFIRSLKPKSIVEVGSGFSSLIAIEALRKNGGGRLTCIEPFPRPFIKSLHDEGVLDLLPLRAQDITPDVFDSLLADGDILFIDSTHTVKTGSDCLHLYLRVIPRLQRKLYIHVHDVFLPFGMPKQWLIDSHIYWTEQYLLMALLIDNPKMSVVFGSAYHQHFNSDLLADFMRNRCAGGGSSLWIQSDPSGISGGG